MLLHFSLKVTTLSFPLKSEILKANPTTLPTLNHSEIPPGLCYFFVSSEFQLCSMQLSSQYQFLSKLVCIPLTNSIVLISFGHIHDPHSSEFTLAKCYVFTFNSMTPRGWSVSPTKMQGKIAFGRLYFNMYTFIQFVHISKVFQSNICWDSHLLPLGGHVDIISGHQGCSTSISIS